MMFEGNRPTSSETTKNPFARVLYFYYLFQRSKLSSPQDLDKIVRKYRNKPESLVVDLQSKYEFPVPECVSKPILLRLTRIFPISVVYIQQMGVEQFTGDYDAQRDICSSDFSVAFCLGNLSTLIASDPHVSPLDNLTKVRALLKLTPGSVEKGSHASATDHKDRINEREDSYEGKTGNAISGGSSNSSSSSSGGGASTSVDAAVRSTESNFDAEDAAAEAVAVAAAAATAKSKHPFVEMAELALQPRRGRDQQRAGAKLSSPLLLLKECMEQRARVRIIIRRKNW